MSNIYLIEITAAIDATGATTTLYFSSHGFTSKPSHTPANTFFEGRLSQPALMRRDIFSNGTTMGQSRVGFGEVLLVNLDGGLDYMIDYGYDGRSIIIRYGDETASYPSGFTTVFKGTMEQASFEFKQVSIKIKDRQAELASKKFQLTKYTGGNILPNGLEGLSTDLKGKPKPRCYGEVFNISPPQVNTSMWIYQVNDGAISTISKVYDRGIELTKGADYTSQSDMETTSPLASNFRVWTAGGYFRLGSKPDGLITCDAVQGAASANRTVAQIVNNIVQNIGGIASGDVSSSDITALDTANNSVVGVYVDSESDISTVIDELTNSIGAWWGFDNAGVFRMQQFTIPSGTPVAYLTDIEAITIERTGTYDTGKGIPAYQVQLSYKKNYTVQEIDINTSVTSVRIAELKESFHKVTSTDNNIRLRHLLAPVLVIGAIPDTMNPLDAVSGAQGTLLTVESDAQAEANRLLTIYKSRRDRVNLTMYLDKDTISVIDIGKVVQVTINRFGYNVGKLFRVIGIQTDLRTNKVELSLWG